MTKTRIRILASRIIDCAEFGPDVSCRVVSSLPLASDGLAMTLVESDDAASTAFIEEALDRDDTVDSYATRE